MTLNRIRPFWIFLLLAVLSSGIYAFYVCMDTGQLWSPLDDAFIYAQYAKEIAHGHPYQFQPGEGMTTGVTSPLYPWLLVPAFWIGLGGEAIVWWWMLLGILWRVWVPLLLFKLILRWTRDRRAAWVASILVCLSGHLNWAYSSGMEVGMMAVILLLSLLAAQRWVRSTLHPGTAIERKCRWAFGVALAFLLLSRPEGTATGFLAMAVLGWELRRRGREILRAWASLLWAFLPWIAWMIAVRIGTDTFAISSGAVKTAIGIPGYGYIGLITTWFSGVRQTFSTDLMGYGMLPIWGWGVAAIGAAALAVGRRGFQKAIDGRLPVVWLVGLTIPAFSLAPFIQNIRYQAAHIPLLIGLGVYGVWKLGAAFSRIRAALYGGLGGLAAILLLSGFFVMGERFAIQNEDMFFLHRRVAHWVAEHTEPDDRIAVTDTGIIPYLTGRKVVDFVGLTNREMMGLLGQGPGAIWHVLETFKPEQRPDYLAMFPTWFDASPIGTEMAVFRVDRISIAVGNEMIISKWTPPLPHVEKRVPPEARAFSPNQSLLSDDAPTTEASGDSYSSPSFSTLTSRNTDEVVTPTWRLVDFVDMADLRNERSHRYRYRNEARWRHDSPAPLITAQSSRDYLWKVADGGRSWTAWQSFQLTEIDPEKNLRLALRSYSDNPHRLRVFVENREVGILSVPKNNRSGIFDILVFEIKSDDLKGNFTPEIRFEMVRDGERGEFPYHTSFCLWALQVAHPGEPGRSDLETHIENRIAREERRWAEEWRATYGDVLPIDSDSHILFQTGWATPDQGMGPPPCRWGFGPSSYMIVPTPETPGDRVLEVELEPYCPPGRRKVFWNWIAVEFNGTELVRWDIEPRRQVYRVFIPGDLFYPDVNGLRFVYARTYVPAQFEPNNPDQRPLGGHYYDIRFVEPSSVEME